MIMAKGTWIEIFRTGTHKGHKFVEEDLHRIVEASRGKAIPLRDGGHGSSGQAGTIAELAVRDGSLFGRVEGVSAAVRERIVAAGFSGVSAAIEADTLVLDHVALLGGTSQPAVKGMLPPGVSFADGHTTLTQASDAAFDIEYEAGRAMVGEQPR